MSTTPPRSRSRAESFVRGALVITLAGLVTRLIGAVYKPIIARLFAPFDGHLGDAGLGLVQVPAPAYLIILSVSSVGINIAISRLVAERLAQGRPAAAWRVFQISLAIMTGLGLVLSVAFYALAGPMAAWAGRPETAPGFQAIAPAIFLVSVMAAFRGLFQGRQQMTPYALSQVYEQLVRIGTGILLVYLFAPRSVPLAAAGYNFGAATGGLAGLIYLAWVYWRQRHEMLPAASLAADPPEPLGEVVRRILTLAAPIAVVGAVQPLIMLADSMLVINRLEAAAVVAAAADTLLGQLGNSYAIILLPTIVTTSLYISLVPAITESLALGRTEQARQRAATAYRLTLLLGLPATVGIWVLADDVYKLFFLGNGGAILAGLAPATLFMMLQQSSSGILQGTGDISTPVRNFLLGLLLKVGLTYWWTALPGFGAMGAAYATGVAFAATAGLNIWFVRRRMGRLVGIVGSWMKPGAAAAAMGLVSVALQGWLTPALGSQRLALVATVMCSALVYGAVLVLIRGVRADDLQALPRIGTTLARWLERRGLLDQ